MPRKPAQPPRPAAFGDVIPFCDVANAIIELRGEKVILDRDVAVLYGVETRLVNLAVKNNPDKFPSGYVLVLEPDEVKLLRSKLLTLDAPGRGHHSKHGYKAFTEIVMPDLETVETESTLELNFIIGKIKHTVKRIKKR